MCSDIISYHTSAGLSRFENIQEVRGVDETKYDKKGILAMLESVFHDWEKLLAGMSEEQINARPSSGEMSVKDTMTHLWGWQQRSVARSEAALHNAEPHYPDWPVSFRDEPDENVDEVNAWIYETNKDKPWSAVYANWREQFARFLRLSEQIPEADLLTPEKYAWMDGYPLGASLVGSYEHHQEHLEHLLGQGESKNGNNGRANNP